MVYISVIMSDVFFTLESCMKGRPADQPGVEREIKGVRDRGSGEVC